MAQRRLKDGEETEQVTVRITKTMADAIERTKTRHKNPTRSDKHRTVLRRGLGWHSWSGEHEPVTDEKLGEGE